MKTKMNLHVPCSVARKRNIGVVLLLVLQVATLAHAQLTPSDDAYVNSAAPTTNYGTATTLDLSSAADTAFIRFDLTAVPASYTGSSVAKATLKLYVNSVTTAGNFNVDYVTGTWTEQTIKYNLQPAIGTTVVASVPLTATSKGKYVEIDITPAMVEWLNGTQTNDGIALVANSPLVATFDSKENTSASHPPELDVVYTSGGGITGITTASGSGLTGGGTSGTLNLSLTNACAANQVLEWNGTTWVCANLKGNGTITGVTAGTDLTGGGTGGNVTLNLDTTKVPQLNAANTFTQLMTVTATNNTGGTITCNNNSPDYATAAVQGNASFTGTGSTIGVEGYSQSSAGWGVYGIGGAAGVYGGSTLNGVFGNSTTGNGVYGQTTGLSGSGVYGVNSVNGAGTGVKGQATGSSGQGVWGESFGNSFANGVGADGVHGVAHTSAGSGVAGQNLAQDGTGVWGSDTSGYGFATDSHVQQGRSASGWVKAMVYVDPSQGGIQRCFNSQLPGSQATTVPCGMNYTYIGLGKYTIDFGFQVDDRFLQATIVGVPVGISAGSVTTTQVSVLTGNTQDEQFHLIVF